MMEAELKVLRDQLLVGIQNSKQGSYSRRVPAKAALPHLIKARDGLRSFVDRSPDNGECWRLLSQAEECLLNYPAAISALEKAISRGDTKSRKDAKRMALLKEYAVQWNQLLLSPAQLESLGDTLRAANVNDNADGRTLRLTKKWLEDQDVANPEAVLDALRARGGYSDFLVLFNVVRG